MGSRSAKILRTLVLSTLVILLCVTAVCLAAHFVVGSAGEGLCFDRVDAVPAHRYALLLGCPKTESWTGQRSEYYDNRIAAVAALFHAGKCERIIVSSDVDARTMLADVRAAGVPDDCLVADSLGVRTLDSVVRAATVFNVRGGILVSQRYHNERALYLAGGKHCGWVAFDAAECSGAVWGRAHSREAFARVRAVIDKYFGPMKPVSTKPPQGRRI